MEKGLVNRPYPRGFPGSPGTNNNKTGGTRLIQREILTGLLLPFLSETLKNTKMEFEQMNAAISDNSERDTT
jgi:hypothetical protein